MPDQDSTVADLVASASHHPEKEDRVSDKEASCMLRRPDASLNELIDATLSWQSSDSDLINDKSASSTGDNSTTSSSYLGNQDTVDGPGDEGDISPTGSAEDDISHYLHDTIWRTNTTPPPHYDPPADDNDDDTWHDDISLSHHHPFSSLNDSPIFDEGSYVDFSD